MVRILLVAALIASSYVIVAPTRVDAAPATSASTLRNAWTARITLLRRAGGGTNVSPN